MRKRSWPLARVGLSPDLPDFIQARRLLARGDLPEGKGGSEEPPLSV